MGSSELPSTFFAVATQPHREGRPLQDTRGQVKNRLSSILFPRHETEAVEFQEEYANHESGAFVAVRERMVTNDPARVQGGEIHNVSISIRMVLAWAREGRLQKAAVPQSGAAAMDGEETIVDRDGVPPLDPDRLSLHFDKAWSVLR